MTEEGDILQPVSDASCGFFDALSINLTKVIRESVANIMAMPSPTDYESGSYLAGTIGSYAVGWSRIAYAGTAKAGSWILRAPGQASRFRERLKLLYRGGGKVNRARRAYGSEEDVRKAAGRTSFRVNLWATGTIETATYNLSHAGSAP